MNCLKLFFILLIIHLNAEYSMGQNISFGQCLSDNLELSSSVNAYTLENVSSEDKIIIRASKNNSFIRPCVKLYHTDDLLNSIAESCQNSFDAWLEKIVDQDGDYLISIEDFFSDNAGDYSIFVERANSPLNSQEIECGASLTTNLNCKDEMDSFFFESADNATFIVTASMNNSSFVRPCIQIRDINGNVIIEDCENSFDAQLQFNIPNQNCVLIFIYDFFQDNSGEVNLTLTNLGGGCITPPNCSGSTIEICNNNLDDDGDDLIDCEDPDCGAPIINTVMIQDASSNNTNDGQITIEADGSNLQYSINGIDFQTSNIFTDLPIGNYEITVQNASTGCSTDYNQNPVFISGGDCSHPPVIWTGIPEIICSETEISPTLDNSHVDFNYQLLVNENPIGDLLGGTGQPINFSEISISETAVFSLTATLQSDPNCILELSPIASIEVSNLMLSATTFPESNTDNNGRIDLCINNGTAPFNLNYSPNRGSFIAVPQPCEGNFEVTELRAGFYDFMVTDSIGCEGNLIIQVENPDERRIGFPEKPLITPNNDGWNDQLIYDGLFQDAVLGELIIYDRFGGIIFQEKPYLNDWNGTFQKNGEPAPDGVYFYTLKIEGLPDVDAFTGFITLLR